MICRARAAVCGPALLRNPGSLSAWRSKGESEVGGAKALMAATLQDQQAESGLGIVESEQMGRRRARPHAASFGVPSCSLQG